MFNNYVFGEPNDACQQAYRIQPNVQYQFLPDDRNDWYVLDVVGTGTLSAELRNFVPLYGQIALYKGDSCSSRNFLGNIGAPGLTKIVTKSAQTSGQYYIYISNDGSLNFYDHYTLIVRFPQ